MACCPETMGSYPLCDGGATPTKAFVPVVSLGCGSFFVKQVQPFLKQRHRQHQQIKHVTIIMTMGATTHTRIMMLRRNFPIVVTALSNVCVMFRSICVSLKSPSRWKKGLFMSVSFLVLVVSACSETLSLSVSSKSSFVYSRRASFCFRYSSAFWNIFAASSIADSVFSFSALANSSLTASSNFSLVYLSCQYSFLGLYACVKAAALSNNVRSNVCK